ncbi:MAG: haloalkane dehalogenase [Gammaproteobacteria bacterium]
MQLSVREHPKQKISVLGLNMAYVEMGQGDPIVFLHSNPTSSYVWRNIIPHVARFGRCIAVDYIGMGDSDKLPFPDSSSYSFIEHRCYVDAFLEEIGATKNIIFVGHCWGAALAFDWGRRHPDAVKGFVHMEALVKALDSWEDFPDFGRLTYQALRSSVGEDMIFNANFMVQAMLPSLLLRRMSAQEYAIYERPFRNPADRWPMLAFPRQLPVAGKPEDTHLIFNRFSEWMSVNGIPKLFLAGNPGGIMTEKMANYCRTWPNQVEVPILGSHHIQEDSPDEIGQAIATWIEGLQ